MKIQKLNTGQTSDFIQLLTIFNEVFENTQPLPSHDYLSTLLENLNFMVFIVKLDDRVVGGLTIYVLPGYYGTQPSAYIYDVGIHPDYQRQGLGKALIAVVCQFCQENGFADAYVEAESDDTDAVSFYRKTKIAFETNAIHFNYTLDNQ